MLACEDRTQSLARRIRRSGLDPSLLGYGRFVQADPIGVADGLNLYRYAGNDPINSSDSSGLYRQVCTNVPHDNIPGERWYSYECRYEAELSDLPFTRALFGEGPLNSGYRQSGGGGGGGGDVDVSNNISSPSPITADPQNRCAGPVRAEGVNFTGILGIGVTASVGKVTVNGSGSSSWFVSVGVGAGLDAGISGFGTYYNNLSSFSGYGESYNGAVALGARSVGGSISYNVFGQRTGYSANGSGLPGVGLGLRAGASGTATETVLFGSKCN